MEQEHLKPGWLERHRRSLLIAGPGLVLLGAGLMYLNSSRYVSTDDAYVGAGRTDVSTNVAGRVVSVFVKDNQVVHRGDPLLKLDDRDFAIAVTGAEARLASVRLQIAGLQASYLQHQAEVGAAREAFEYQERELDRQKRLAAQGISSQSQLEQAQHAWAQARQKVLESQQEQENILAALNHHPGQDIATHPLVREAQAALDRARLNLSYTLLTASQEGVVTKVEQLQVGNYVTAATPLFALVSARNVWIEANFRETDLARMHPGQKSRVEIDAYPGQAFHGRVESLSPGTGSSFSLLPPENATGNWVKVVQRLPVRIGIEDADPRFPLRAGLSATVEVDIRHD